MAGPVRVAIVDDHPVVRQGIRRMLSDYDGVEIVAEAGSGLEALTMLVKSPPDLVLLDIVLPEVDGMQVLRELRRRLPQTRVLIISALDSDYSVRTAVENEADGYVSKQASREELILAIRTAMAGGLYLPPGHSGALGYAGAGPVLTSRQMEVLKCMAAGASNKEIAKSLGVTPETVKSHVTEILHRLNVRDRTSAVAKALHDKLI